MLGLNPWAILICSLAVAGALGGSYLKGRSDGKAVVIASQAKAEAVRLETLQLAQLAAAEEIAKIQIVNKTVYQRATREIIKEPVYRDCLHSADGLQSVNSALTGRSESAGEVVVSGTDAAGGEHVRRDDAQAD